MVVPEPVIQMSVEPKTKGDSQKMDEALAKLAEEDPTFRTYTDEETGQTIIAGVGELQLDIIMDRMRREFKVEATSGAPQVAYRETIRKEAEVQGKFVRQSGGHGQYGDVWIRFSPNPGKGFEFVDETVGGSVPKEFIKPTQQGLEESLNNNFVESTAAYDKNGVMLSYESGQDKKDMSAVFEENTDVAYCRRCLELTQGTVYCLMPPVYREK